MYSCFLKLQIADGNYLRTTSVLVITQNIAFSPWRVYSSITAS